MKMSSITSRRELGSDHQLIGGGGGGGSSSSSSTRCQDCGNQAKKNCEYMRCRTCCKRRGYDCETHVKSTWIPSYRRRLQSYHHHPHHLQLLSVQDQHHHHHHHSQLFQEHSYPKRLRVMMNPSLSSSQGLEMRNFPAEVTSEATFRCVKVSSIGDGDAIDQTTLAYQTAINVGGHIFRGILHYHGPAGTSSFSNNAGESSSSDQPPPPPRYPFTVAALTTTGASAEAEAPYPPPYALPFSSYASAGTQFFPQYPKYKD